MFVINNEIFPATEVIDIYDMCVFFPFFIGTPEEKKKAGIISRTKSWFAKKFRSFRKSNSN